MLERKITPKERVALFINRMFFLTLGAFIAAFALECFLVPNNIIDGGVVGISMITSYLTKLNLGLLVVILNIPFLCFAFTKMGKYFVFQTLYAVTMLAIGVNLFQPYHITDDLLLATVFGGIILGTGVGIVLKSEGSLDGTEIMSLVLSKKFGLSVGEIIMAFNVFIYFGAGLVFGWNKAMYSVLTYFIAYRVIDIVLEGLNSSKSVRIISDKAYEIGQELIDKFEISVTYLKGIGGYSKQEKVLIYCVVSRLELTKVKEVVKEFDKKAFMSIGDIHETYGSRMGKYIDKI